MVALLNSRPNLLLMKEQIVDLLLNSELTYTDISRQVGCSVPTVTYHAKKLGFSSKSKRIDWRAVERYHHEGHSMVECMEKFSFSRGGWGKAVSYNKIHTKPVHLITAEEAFCVDSSTTRGTLKRLLSAEGRPYRCEVCGLSEWRDKSLSLQLDHINGERHDNRRENLRLICPNCHSQTPTFSGRNICSGDD